MTPLPIGKSETLREGADVAIIAVGATVPAAEAAAGELALDGVNATVINARFVKPLDEEAILAVADRCGAIVTVEENAVAGGFGSAVLELLSLRGVQVPVVRLGLADQLYEQASQGRLRELAGIDAAGIVSGARQVMAQRRAQAVLDTPPVAR
jgi:1-deoxy-D-xylulose-5-phosphate synthase